MFKDIEGYEGFYQISDDGRVISVRKNKELKAIVTKLGYKMVRLSVNGHTKTHCVHRLVAEAFIPNPHNKKTVNHISGDKLDNNVENLEWATYSENANHSLYVLGNHVHPVECIETGKKYRSIAEAARETGLHNEKISMVCRGERNKTGGLHWRLIHETI